MNANPPTVPLPLSARRQSGFTLAELLLASVLGAMLLTALAVSTFGFTSNLDHLEQVAGVSGDDADPVLRRMTRDIREAWWAEMPSANDLKLAATDGSITEYYVDGSQLFIKRPNGDTGVLFKDFVSAMLEPSYVDRYREGPVVSNDGIWYQSAAVSGTASTIVATSGEQIALSFVAPVLPKDVPAQSDLKEEVLSVSTSVFDLPIAWKSGSGTNKFSMTLYEGWAPGLARPTGSGLVTSNVTASSMPLATQTSGVWDVPSSTVALSLSAALVPGTGYTLVLKPLGNTNTLVLKAVFPASLPAGIDQVSKKGTSASAPWVQQLAVVPFDVKGPWTQSTTLVTSVISCVTITITPNNRPLQQRSAALLSQALTDDPWLGVVPGQAAP